MFLEYHAMRRKVETKSVPKSAPSHTGKVLPDAERFIFSSQFAKAWDKKPL